MRFFNREKEIKEILSILEGELNSIYFISWTNKFREDSFNKTYHRK